MNFFNLGKKLESPKIENSVQGNVESGEEFEKELKLMAYRDAEAFYNTDAMDNGQARVSRLNENDTDYVKKITELSTKYLNDPEWKKEALERINNPNHPKVSDEIGTSRVILMNHLKESEENDKKVE